MEPGEKKSVVIAADEAYGPYRSELRRALSRDQFPVDIKPEAGMQINVKEDDEEKVIRVVEVTDSSITLDANHPMSGKDLFFDIALIDIVRPGPPASFYFMLGSALQEKGLIEEAIQHYNEAIETDPGLLDAYFELGVLCQVMGCYDDAESSYRKVVELNPDHLKALINLGDVLRLKGDADEAISLFNRALEIKPDYAPAYNNLGIAFAKKQDIDNALLNYKKAVELDEEFAEAHNNLGMALHDASQFREAEYRFRKAIQINGDFAEARFNLASVLLLSGQFREGWNEYEWRLKLREFGRAIPGNYWDGEDAAGKSILLIGEQGFGDVIQFMRYAPLVAEKGAAVLLACQRELSALLGGAKGVSRVIPFEEALPPANFECCLLSLPRIFGTTIDNIPSAVPYITADALSVQRWKSYLANDQAKLRVGLAWTGDPSYRKDYLRSVRLGDLMPLLKMRDIYFYRLQKGKFADAELAAGSEPNLVDLTYLMQDFSDSAALIANLDLIISVDTAVAHLAGAMGKPVWTLLPFVPDWRWMLERQDSPWYPTMRLFRQPSPGDWGTVIDRVAGELSLFRSDPAI